MATLEEGSRQREYILRVARALTEGLHGCTTQEIDWRDLLAALEGTNLILAPYDG